MEGTLSMCFPLRRLLPEEGGKIPTYSKSIRRYFDKAHCGVEVSTLFAVATLSWLLSSHS